MTIYNVNSLFKWLLDAVTTLYIAQIWLFGHCKRKVPSAVIYSSYPTATYFTNSRQSIIGSAQLKTIRAEWPWTYLKFQFTYHKNWPMFVYMKTIENNQFLRIESFWVRITLHMLKSISCFTNNLNLSLFDTFFNRAGFLKILYSITALCQFYARANILTFD